MVNTLLTGCTSFLGHNFMEHTRLRRLNARIVCITRRLPHYECNSSDIIYLLTSEPADMSIDQYCDLIEKNRIEAIVHCASLVGDGKGSWMDYFKINTKWTLNLAKAFTKADADHRIFIYISTVGVHGTIPSKVPCDETMSYAPDGYYHTSKMVAEKGLIGMTSRTGLPLVILRPTIMYGKYDQGFLWKILKISRKFFLPLPTSTMIHLLDVKTAVQAIDTCILNPQKSDVFIVGDREPVNLRDLLSFLGEKITNIKLLEIPNKPVQIIEPLITPLRKYANITLLCKSWYYDTSKLRSILNVEPSNTVNNIGNHIWWYTKAH